VTLSDALTYIEELRQKCARARRERTCADGSKGVSRRRMQRLQEKLDTLDQDALYVYRSWIAATTLDSTLTLLNARSEAFEREPTKPDGIPLEELDVEHKVLG
jgi:hypothetical protein